MSKRQERRRSEGEGHFFQMYEWLMRTPAWQHATVYERSLYLEIKRRYNGRNNGDISLSHREAEALLDCSNTAVEKAFKGLQCKGFIKPQQKGSFDWKINGNGGRHQGRATRWRLTELPQDLPSRELAGGTKEFMKWAPGFDLSEKTAARPQRTNGPLTTDHSENMARSQRTIEDGVTAHVGR
ncbi:hypothetical protein C1D09_018855 [Mesorhizobium intechi]|uniref:hypothetical protein n=1 Tax=Mesorhizobium intechi TaxID=537601 RepID=UPI000CACF6C2|nr:hypothetical protein [Mesorhizobium intechi]TSE07592.1 hypothetical protein C1D09_018855 [Mesorhizobium intechi]